jgi:hypothetical protein
VPAKISTRSRSADEMRVSSTSRRVFFRRTPARRAPSAQHFSRDAKGAAADFAPRKNFAAKGLKRRVERPVEAQNVRIGRQVIRFGDAHRDRARRLRAPSRAKFSAARRVQYGDA